MAKHDVPMYMPLGRLRHLSIASPDIHPEAGLVGTHSECIPCLCRDAHSGDIGEPAAWCAGPQWLEWVVRLVEKLKRPCAQGALP